MIEQLISFKVAKLAHEKGLRMNTCTLVYEDTGKLESIGRYKDKYWAWEPNFISALTLGEFQYWLRTQQIFIDILTDQTAEPKFTYQINKFVGNPNDLTEKVWYWELPIISEYLYKTYEECLEVAEQEALKLLP